MRTYITRRPRRGVLEVTAQRVIMSWNEAVLWTDTGDAPSERRSSFEVRRREHLFAEPRFVSNTSASTYRSLMDQGVSGVTIDSLATIAKTGVLVALSLHGDGAGSNIRNFLDIQSFATEFNDSLRVEGCS